MNKKALQEVLAGLRLSLRDNQAEQLLLFQSEMLKWNSRINLTGITTETEIYVKHYYDSLLLMSLPEWNGQSKIVDVGTGAGFPGIPLKIINPALQILLLDSLRKRVLFLEHIIGILNLEQATALHRRAEEAGRDANLREKFDIAVSRAVAKLPVLLEFCLPLVRTGGHFFAYKGPEAAQEAEEADGALSTLQGKIVRIEQHTLPHAGGERSIIVIRKSGITPDSYPRKPGVPEKRPLK